MLSERAFWTAVETLLVLACAGYWFGNSGLGLAILWLARPGWPRRPPPPTADLVALQPVWVGQRRLCLQTDGRRQIEIYRDEVGPGEWAALKRRCLQGQLATGRKTSI